MWRSYLQVFLRNLVQQKTIALINILGLALGLCAFLVISIYVRDEYSHESRWQNADRIVRLVNFVAPSPGSEVSLANVSDLAGPRLAQFLPDEIAAAARIEPIASMVSVDGASFRRALFRADSELIDIFDFEVTAGSLQQTMAAPNRIALSEETAGRLFGDEAALGKVLSWDVPARGELSYEVTAVYRVPPGKGDLEFDNFSLWEAGPAAAQTMESWFGGTRSYFLLREGVKPAALASRLDDFVDQHVTLPFPTPANGTTADVFKYRLQSIRDMHFQPNTDEQGASQTTVNIFGLIAALVLVIGWSNFVILALARSVERQREVGIRKTAGATGEFLLAQFIAEALLLAFIALLVALVMLEFALPAFAALMQTTLSIDLTDGVTLAFLAVLVVVTGSIGGLYPALVLARQKPELVLKPGAQQRTIGSGLLRKSLVSFQFLVATLLIIATSVLYLQLSHLRQRDPGFDTANVVTLDLQDVVNPGEVAVLRNAVANIPGVQRVALTSHEAATPGNLFIDGLRRDADASVIEMTTYHVDYDFFAIYAMPVLAGRTWSNDLDSGGQPETEGPSGPRLRTQRNDRIVLNETASRALGFATPADAIGAVIDKRRVGRDNGVIYDAVEIIGVVADNQFGSLRTVPGSETYALQSLSSWYLTIKVDAASMSNITEDIRAVWQQMRPFDEAQIAFADTRVQQAFIRELNEGRLLLGFAALAIVGSCMGLYGLVAFETRRRTQEIGIRNVLGGAFTDILKVFLAQFGRPLLWTNALGWPLAAVLMLRWLERFPYRIEGWWLLPVCLGAAVLVISTVALTVTMTVARAVEVKPAYALRQE